ncbi:MAG: Gfo/Idh/MocA family oxidoreductase [Verrucomicrobiae bacterium]|nr:Gfo/Idh/MocA family oxidoreductase [Verrucomicrobiae bacterium]
MSLENEENSSPIKVALLGAGWFGREAHLRNLLSMEGVEVAAVSSRSDASLDAAREMAGSHLRVFNDWREALSVETVQAVIIALTNDQHHEAALAALEAGKHVLCEKPLGLTVKQCDEVIAVQEASGKVLQIGHEMRFQRLYQEVKSMIERGAIGDPQLMWCREFRGPMRMGWRSSEALTGGTILEKNIHHIDLFNWMMETPPVRVSAHGGTNVLTDREVLDNAQVLVEYEGGRRASLELCLFAPYGGDCEIGVAGDLGRIDTKNQALSLVHHRFDLPDRTEMQIADSKEDANFVDSSGRIDRGIRPELVHFFDCICEGKPPLNDGAASRMAVAVCLAAQESIKRKESVWIEEILG